MRLSSSVLPIQTSQDSTTVHIQMTDSRKEMPLRKSLFNLMASELQTDFEVVVGWNVVHDLLTATESLLSTTAVSA